MSSKRALWKGKTPQDEYCHYHHRLLEASERWELLLGPVSNSLSKRLM